MARSAEMFSSGTRQAFSVANARASISGRTAASRDFNSASSRRCGARRLWSFSWAIMAMCVSVLLVGGARPRAGGRDAVGRVLIDQRLNRIVHVDGHGFADEDRVRAVGNGRDLPAEDVDLRVREIA